MQKTLVFDDLMMAARHGLENDVVRILKNHTSQAHKDRALAIAAAHGRVSCLKILLPVSNPGAEESLALRWACEFGRLECVELLLPVSDLLAAESAALYAACEYEYTECIDLLYSGSDVPLVLNRLQLEYPNNYEKWQYLQQKHEADLLHDVVEHVVCSKSHARKI